jgi:hypothetical protein
MKKSVGGNRAARSGKKPSFRALANVMGKGRKLKNESVRGPAKILMPRPSSRTSPTGALGGVMILPLALRSVACLPVSSATCTCWVPAESTGKVKRQVMSSTRSSLVSTFSS